MAKEKKDKVIPTLDFEIPKNQLYVGTDEAGRGCWAGPIFGAAVYIPEGAYIPEEIKDSKAISEKVRDEMYEYIIKNYICRVTHVSAKDIDEKGLQWANKYVMSHSVAMVQLLLIDKYIDMTYIDGNMKFEQFPTPYKSVIKGDALIPSISAASILAKVSRDEYMKGLALREDYTPYQFEKHKGYGTQVHMDALEKYGVTDEHRKSYKPIKEYMKKGL